MDEKISYRTIGGMAIIWLLLLGYLVRLPVPSEHPVPAGVFVLEGASISQLTRFSISTPDGRNIQYLKTLDEWMMLEPYRVAADESMINELLTALGNTRIMDIVEKQPEDLSVYGLEENEMMSLALEREDGTVQTFRFGARLPLNQIYVYFQREGDPAVFRVWEGVRLSLEKHAAVLDRGRPVRFDPDQIVSLDVTHGIRSLHLQKRDENWLITRPVERAAAQQVVHAYLESVLSLTSRGVYPVGDDVEEKLSGPGSLRLVLRKAKPKGSIVLRLAAADSATPALLMIEQDGRSALYLTAPDALEQLAFVPDAFFLPQALLLDPDTLTTIEVSHPHYSFGLDRGPEGLWWFRYPSAGQGADSDMVGQLMHLLGNMTVEEYLEAEAENAALPESAILIKISGKSGSQTLRISDSPAGTYRGTSTRHPNWYRLDRDTVKRLEDYSPESLVDRHLLWFDPRSVEQVAITQDGQDYVLARRGSGWEWEEPVRRMASSAVAWKLVFGIRDMQYRKPAEVSEIEETGDDRCRIKEATRVIRVLLAEKKSGGEIRMQSAGTGKYMIVSTSRFHGCYELEMDVVEQLFSDLADLVGR